MVFYILKQNSLNCSGYSDSDWAGDSKDRKSTSGYCFKISGGVISWKSNKQNCVALSTAEAEYVALSSASQEAIWLIQLLNDLNIHCQLPFVIYEDNQAAISICNNPTHHPKTKHISIKYHYIKDQISQNKIEVKYCSTDNMIADVFTKGLPADKFNKLRYMLGVISHDQFHTM